MSRWTIRRIPVVWRVFLLPVLNLALLAVLAAVIWSDVRQLARQWVEIQGLADLQRQDDARYHFEEALYSAGGQVALMGLGCLLITLGTGLIISGSIRRPIRQLAAEISAITAGDLSRPIPGTGAPDEIGAIARALAVLKNKAMAKGWVESRLEAQERRWWLILESSPIGFSIVRASDHRRLYANPKYREMLGLTGDAGDGGMAIRESFVDPADYHALRERAERGETVSGFEVERRRSDGSTWWSILELKAGEIDGQAAYMVWHYDVTARRRTEAELRAAKERAEAMLADLQTAEQTLAQSEKMASLGGLVAGVAHELNTPLGISLTSASLLAEESRHLSEIMHAGALRRSDLTRFLALALESSDLLQVNAQRAADLIRCFKQVAVDQSSNDRRTYNLRDYIDEVLMSLGPRLKRSALAVQVVCADDIEAEGFPGALAQVLTNFVMNSLTHAFEPGQAGHLRVAVTVPVPDVIELSYSDDGKGIAEEVLPHIFEPFFTTNRRGGGSGLGLNIVDKLVRQQMHGEIIAASTPGQGTRFTVHFPRVL